MVPSPHRLFIGLMPDRQVQAAIQRHCRLWEWPADAKPTRFGRYHLTLNFLGEVGVAPEQRLRQVLRKVAVEPLELELRIPEVWRNGVAVLQPADHDGLKALHGRIKLAVSAAGLTSADREFRPHVTLARNAAQAKPPDAVPPIRWRVDEVLLVWSVLYPQAKPARYEIVERFGVTPGSAPQSPASSGEAGEQFSLGI
jgi:RNA 2',3'-cyclic 3'-phosphodiesterase